MITLWKLSVRNILKHKTYSAINILGLALGFTAFILVNLFVQHELSWDKHNENYDRIYRVQRVFENISHSLDGNNISPHSRGLMAKLLEDGFPEFEKVTAIREYGNNYISPDSEKLFKDEGAICADNNFFDVFSYSFTNGDPNLALDEPMSIVLSKKTADMLFPGENPLEKTVTFEKKHDLKVTGVYKDLPDNSILKPGYILSMSSLKEIEGMEPENSMSGDFMTFGLVRPGTSIAAINTKIRNLFQNFNDIRYEKLKLYPLSILHLSSNERNDYLIVLNLFGTIGIFILIMSAFNYINLTAAKSSTRSKEIAIKKISGSNRRSLFFQFLFETVMLAVVALGISFALAKLILPTFNSVVGKEMQLSLITNSNFIITTCLILLLVGVLAGIYPSILLSSQKALHLIKGEMIGQKVSKLVLQKTLVFFQFGISVFLIGVTLLIAFQVKYLINKELGFNKEDILYAKVKSNNKTANFEQIRDRLLKHPEIIDASMAKHIPFISYGGGTINWEGGPENEFINVRYNFVDDNFLKNFDIALLSGRDFSKEFPADVGNACLINETAARNFGWDDPLGKRINNNQWRVVGVVNDYHFKDMHNFIEPAVLILHSGSLNGEWTYAFRILSGKKEEARRILTQEFENIFPNDPFEFRELDMGFRHESTMLIYQSINKTILFFTVFNILLAVFGLLGLVTFNLVRRSKEIGIRKINGSTSVNIFMILTKEYFILMILSLVVAWPGIYYFHSIFPGAFKLPLQPLLFVLSVVIILIIIIISTGYQTFRASTRNPVEVLKYE